MPALDNDPREESALLGETLKADHVPPDQLEAGYKEFSAKAKNELVADIARTFNPPPLGRLLSRLPFILTDENKEDMIKSFLLNLTSPYPEARKASLYGLDKLRYSAIVDLAIASLRDSSDEVVTAACSILLSSVGQDSRINEILRGVYEAHKDKSEFYVSVNLLKAQSFIS